MASRTSGRGEERSGGRNASGSSGNTTRRQGAAAQGTADTARQNATSSAGQSASQSGSQRPSATQGQNASQSRDTQPQQREASSSVSESPRRGDQERELRTSREQGNMRPAASSQRGNIGRESGGYGTSSSGAGAGSNPFALMRRMMEDMDRLFSDFGFTTPGMLGSNLLSSDVSPSSGQRSLGGGLSSGSNRSAAQGGQQSLTRGSQRGALQQPMFGTLWSPQVEIFERGNNLVVRADLPGLSRENVDVELDDDALIIRGERQSDTENEDEGFYHSERSYGSFYRAIPLPEGIDASSCNATFRDGVLEVTLPKPQQQPSRSRRIDVRGG